MRPWRSQLPQVLRRGGSVAAAALCLPRRTWDRAVRAEHAAVTRLGPKHGATAVTVVEPLAGGGRHRLGGHPAPEQAGERRIRTHHTSPLLPPTPTRPGNHRCSPTLAKHPTTTKTNH